MLPLEKRQPQNGFQFTNLPAHSSLGNIKLGRGQRETLQPTGHLEAPQGGQG